MRAVPLAALAGGFALASAFTTPAALVRAGAQTRTSMSGGAVALRASTETLERRGKTGDDKSLLLELQTRTITRAFKAPDADKAAGRIPEGAFGEIDYDCPSDRLHFAWRGTAPLLLVDPAFEDEVDFDAPIARQIAARGWSGRGKISRATKAAFRGLAAETAAFGEIDFDAPAARIAKVNRLALSAQTPPSPSAMAMDDEIDFDAPIERIIAARGQ